MAAGTFNILQADQFEGKVKFVGANDVGPKLTLEFPLVRFRPANNPIGFIQDEWGQIQIVGEVLVDTGGSFGTLTHPDTAQVAPLPANYYRGKGVVSVMIDPETTYRDVGNVPVFEFVPNLTVEPHFSSRLGVRTKDLEVITEKQATLNITLEEFEFNNLKLALMGVAAP